MILTTLGDKIKYERILLGLSQHDLATRVGLTQSRISQLESGALGTPSLTTLRRLAAVLGVELWDYLPRT
jgi:transcriptional regulator with XRE-family HTH domain